MNRLFKRNILLNKINNYLYDSLLPINLSYWYNWGSLLGIILILQIISGFFLACYYIADITLAFQSIEYIMKEVPYGYIIRYIHANGAGLFFLFLYLHIARGLIYGSYTRYRIGGWYTGVIILFLLIITAFVGYSLPYGQMSYWAIKVITNLLTVIPYVGNSIVELIYGGYNIGNSTLTRFYALHYLLPFIIVSIVLMHLILIHHKGGSNPLGISNVKSISYIPFHPYYTIKDILGLSLLLILLIIISFFLPNLFNHPDNSIPANPLVTPNHIIPEPYLLYYYMALRAIPNKILGVLTLLSIILILFLLPYLHKGLIITSKFRPFYKFFLFLFFFNFILGTYLGIMDIMEPYTSISIYSTIYYFLFIIIFIPFLSFFDTIYYIYSI